MDHRLAKNLFMALNWQTFRTRTLTAIIFAVVMLAGLLINRWTFLVLFIIIHFGCWIEFIGLLRKINPRTYVPYSLVGLVYITLPVALLISVRFLYGLDLTDRSHEFGKMLVLILIFSLWVNDTMAYIVGSLMGRTRMSAISPKKTWEGTVGGVVLCVAVMAFVGRAIGVDPGDAIVISSIASITGTCGDLLESKLKRMAGVKDSGRIMPGHGGFLDRFDSLLVASTFVWLYIYLFMR